MSRSVSLSAMAQFYSWLKWKSNCLLIHDSLFTRLHCLLQSNWRAGYSIFMEESENTLQDKLLNFAKSNLLVLALFAGGLIFLGIGLIQFFGQKQTEVKFEKGSTVLGSESDSTAKIKVDVEGAVISPGVYELSSGARVQDALIAAGGLASDADRNSINLAAKMADGQKIYIPKKGEEAP